MPKTKMQEMLDRVPPETKRFVSLQNEVAARIIHLMDKKDMGHNHLAEKIGWKDYKIISILAGQGHLNLKEIAELETVLGEEIIEVRNE